MSDPCPTCDYRQWPGGGWCYMFRERFDGCRIAIPARQPKGGLGVYPQQEKEDKA